MRTQENMQNSIQAVTQTQDLTQDSKKGCP